MKAAKGASLGTIKRGIKLSLGLVEGEEEEGREEEGESSSLLDFFGLTRRKEEFLR